MVYTHVHIEVFLKKENRPYLAYEIEDDDICGVLISPFLLKECLREFTADDRVLLVPIELLKERLLIFKKKIICLDIGIETKILNLINFIIKNKENYCGIRTVYSV